jgi:lipopolysaccharide export system protein LptC
MSAIDARQRARDRMVSQPTRRRAVLSARRIALRRFTVLVAKIGLPLLALALLSAIALWPEIARVSEQGRLSFRRVFALQAESGRMLQPRYHGVDERGRPYTLTARWANQSGPNRVELGDPKGDLMLESGNWMQVEAKQGVFIQHAELLDLSKDVVLYRDDGTVVRTDTAAVDVKQGAASSDDKTHAEGPFGVLDAQGFILTDKGASIQFQGPARLILNGGSK